MNVFDFALKMEQDGKAFYEKMAEASAQIGLKGIFTRLAGDEQKHYEIFLALKAQAGAVPQMTDTPVLEQARNVFEGLIKEKGPMRGIPGDLEAYRYAMKIEADSFRLYEEAAQREKNEEVKELLLRIAGEERKHFVVVENVFNFVNAPNEYLAWGEFSNIDEFRQFGRDVDY